MENNTTTFFTFVTDGEPGDGRVSFEKKETKSEKPPTPQELLEHVLGVGPEKPLGFLPTYEIVEYCGWTVDRVKDLVEKKGMKWAVFPASKIRSENLYAYDQRVLGDMLTMNKKILDEFGWPTDVDSFVEKVNTVDVPDNTELYRFIERCFADNKSKKM